MFCVACSVELFFHELSKLLMIREGELFPCRCIVESFTSAVKSFSLCGSELSFSHLETIKLKGIIVVEQKKTCIKNSAISSHIFHIFKLAADADDDIRLHLTATMFAFPKNIQRNNIFLEWKYSTRTNSPARALRDTAKRLIGWKGNFDEKFLGFKKFSFDFFCSAAAAAMCVFSHHPLVNFPTFHINSSPRSFSPEFESERAKQRKLSVCVRWKYKKQTFGLFDALKTKRIEEATETSHVCEGWNLRSTKEKIGSSNEITSIRRDWMGTHRAQSEKREKMSDEFSWAAVWFTGKMEFATGEKKALNCWSVDINANSYWVRKAAETSQFSWIENHHLCLFGIDNWFHFISLPPPLTDFSHFPKHFPVLESYLSLSLVVYTRAKRKKTTWHENSFSTPPASKKIREAASSSEHSK